MGTGVREGRIALDDRTFDIAAVYWNRVEPRPRSPEFADILAARIRDPLWMLTRQWQVGEFAGEDAASPAYAQIKSRTGPVLGWREEGGVMQPVTAPLEELVETESATADDATRVELGLLFAALLEEQGLGGAALSAVLAAYRRDYALNTAGVPDTDRGGMRLAALADGRAIDGVRVAASSTLPNDPAVAAESARVRASVAALAAELSATLGTAGNEESPAWDTTRLEYRVEVAVNHPTSGPLLLRADPDRDAAFEWFTFDALADADPGIAQVVRPDARTNRASTKRPTTLPPADSRSQVPAFVSFRGMPNHRWWDFEPGGTDFGAVAPDRRDIAKLVMMDFMLIHGNDYFIVAQDQPVGTVCKIEQLLLHDVFGGTTLIERADQGATAGTVGRWTMFSLSTADRGGDPSDLFFLPPTAGTHRLAGEALEDVRFVRDEQANYVWAIEHATEGRDGRPWQGHERHVAEVAKEPPDVAPVSASPLFYQLQTFVPWHWFPMVPVSIDPLSGETALEEGRMRRPDGRVPQPMGRVLVGPQPYRVREETITRVGVRVVREAVRSRWLLGDTHLWTARRKLAGRGEGSSGLRYDGGRFSKPPAV